MNVPTKLAVVIALVSSVAIAHAQDSDAKAFKAADMGMMKNMETAPYTGNADVDFRTHMTPHHEGAIAMAEVALKYSKDADTKRLAQNIIAAQEREVVAMQAWLKKHGK
jgi:uncharacterized protein (DUF305 family)